MKFNDTVISSLLLILAGLMYYNAKTLPSLPGQTVGPALFPITISIMLGLVSMAILLKSITGKRKERWLTLDKAILSPRSLISIFLVPASVVFYIAFANTAGFLIVSTVILFVMMVAFRAKLYIAAPLAVVVSSVGFLLFRSVLLVPLPEGAVERALMELSHAV